ncbi:MAG: cysteine peptidase family C39 domain-containing protein, partial [Candidatus Omnitrophota bacterium]
MKKEEIKTQASIEVEEEKSKFHSNFKAWIRIVAFLVVAVFLPEQVAQAVEYDWRVLWNRPALSTFAPTYLNDPRNLNIPIAVKNILKDIAGKPIKSIKISSDLTVELEKPLKITSRRIEEIFNWLQGRPCGSKALYDFLSYQGVKVEEQDIAVLALTIDILNDVVKPEGNPKVIKNSLYALSKAAEFFGLKLSPVKVNLPLTTYSLSLNTPFIAHLKNDHYVLVTRISGEKIYFLEEHKEEFIPLEKFLKQFSGYILTAQGLSPSKLSGSTLKETVPAFVSISDAEAKKVLGARSDGSGPSGKILDMFKEPSTSDLLTSAAISLGVMVASSYLGSYLSGVGGAWGGAAGGAIGGGLGGYVATGKWEGALGGAIGGGIGGYVGGSYASTSGLGSGWSSAIAGLGGGIGGGLGAGIGSSSWQGAIGGG